MNVKDIIKAGEKKVASLKNYASGKVASGINSIKKLQMSSKPQPIPKKDYNSETLKKNTLDQTYYTKEAENQIKKLPIRSGSLSSGIKGLKGGSAAGVYEGSKKGITIDRKYSKPGDSDSIGFNNAVNILRHENVHALDANINGEEASYQRKGNKSGDSYGFYPKLKPKGEKQYIDEFLGGYKDAGEHTMDSESFAEVGAKGNRVMLDKNKKVSDSYEGIYVPATKDIRYSPVFPSREYINRYEPGPPPAALTKDDFLGTPEGEWEYYQKTGKLKSEIPRPGKPFKVNVEKNIKAMKKLKKK